MKGLPAQHTLNAELVSFIQIDLINKLLNFMVKIYSKTPYIQFKLPKPIIPYNPKIPQSAYLGRRYEQRRSFHFNRRAATALQISGPSGRGKTHGASHQCHLEATRWRREMPDTH
jgi:hypothetical protein